MASLPSNSAKVGAINGLDEIKAKLKQLGLNTREIRNINNSAARAGAVALKKVADNNLSSKHRGKKKLDIEKARRGSKPTYHLYKIGPKAEHWPLVFLEYGAKAHDITPNTANVLAIGDFNAKSGTFGEFVYTKRIKHPGINPTHFLSRAIIEGQDEAFKAIGDQYWKRIRKVAK